MMSFIIEYDLENFNCNELILYVLSYCVANFCG
mgnify:CR=1 FL=1